MESTELRARLENLNQGMELIITSLNTILAKQVTPSLPVQETNNLANNKRVKTKQNKSDTKREIIKKDDKVY